MGPRAKFAQYRSRTPAERRLLLEASAWLALSRLAVRLLPFRWIAPRLGRHMAATPEIPLVEHEALLKSVSWAVRAAARHVPFEAVCLPQAMAAKAMLARRGVDATLYLGVQRGEAMGAHAWLRVGDRIVTGRREAASHTVVSTFA